MEIDDSNYTWLPLWWFPLPIPGLSLFRISLFFRLAWPKCAIWVAGHRGQPIYGGSLGSGKVSFGQEIPFPGRFSLSLEGLNILHEPHEDMSRYVSFYIFRVWRGAK